MLKSFIAVSIPLNYNRKHVDQRQIILLSGTWLIALAVASPVMLGINNIPHRDPTECKLEDDNYVVYSSVCSFFIPCPIMLLLYCGMFRGLKRWEEARKAKLRNSIQACRKLQHAAAAAVPPPGTIPGPLPMPLPRIIERDLAQARLGLEDNDDFRQPDCPPFPSEYRERISSVPSISYQQQPQKRKRAKINGRERKAMRVLPVVVGEDDSKATQEEQTQSEVIVPGWALMASKSDGIVQGCFLFCWTPFFIVHTTRALCVTCYIPQALMSTVTWLGYVNSALNPIIYTVFNTEFRKFFKNLL
ncbi:unnamed protein product [Coregonus sp. 'balchen']|nr:unnamed protein product [Coregonus sp. 'balchen']